MYTLHTLHLTDLTTEHLASPIGIDVIAPRFGWILHSDLENTIQTAYRIEISDENGLAADTGLVASDQSIEVTVPGFAAQPMTAYRLRVHVRDNHDHEAYLDGCFETGRMGVPFEGNWVEPVQDPTPSSMDVDRSGDAMSENEIPVDAEGNRTFEEFRPAQYIRIPFRIDKPVKKARIYASAHGLYRLEVNGVRPDEREFAPEITPYNSILLYQTYDVTSLLQEQNVIGVTLGDGWWVGRVGTTGDCCQFGNTLGLLLDAKIEYMDGTTETITAEDGVSSTGPIVFSDLFVGEKYDAGQEMPGWNLPGYDDAAWTPVLKKNYPTDVLSGQAHAPVMPLRSFHPVRIFTTPAGETILDAGQVLAGNIEFTLIAEAGHVITLEHSEVMGQDGNYFNNILNVNKEQTDVYITKEGTQTFRPHFTYHGFRFVRITGWPGELHLNDFTVHVYTSQMEDIGHFETSDPKLNQLQSNIWWSQVSNTVSIPTDCPQREKAGWTGDIMAFAPTLCFNRKADAFLTSWLNSVRKDQLANGAVPMIVPYLKAYETFIKNNIGTDTSCGWGDAVIVVPFTLYRAYGDKRILEENYDSMKRWMEYIRDRAENHHPDDYDTYTDQQRKHDRYLWSTDFHFGDWLIPSIVLGNPDAMAMNNTAYATMRYVAPAYYGFSAKNMAEIASILGQEEDAAYYRDLFEKIKEAYIAEYVHEDGTMDADFQGIYVTTLQMGLVPDEIRPKMVDHLCDMIRRNGDKLDTGFLSVLFLMDVLCDNGRKDVAYKLLYQTGCPSWLYEVESGATTMWESWGAIGEDGSVSSYSYNHYAFGCVGDWMYRTIGGLRATSPAYKTFEVSPDLSCGLTSASVSEKTPYGEAAVNWYKDDQNAVIHVTVPANTTASVIMPNGTRKSCGSGQYTYFCRL